MIKTLLIISIHADPSMPPGVGEWGGTHTYMKELLIELSSTDYNVILITRRAYPEQPIFEQINESCSIHRIDLGSFGYFDKRCLFDLHDITMEKIEALWAAFKNKPDVIHSVYWNSGHVATKLSQKYNVPFVHSVISNGRGRNARGAENTAKNRIETEQLVFDSAKHIICVADSEKLEIIDLYQITAEKIIVAGQYIHPSFLYPAHDEFGGARASSFNNQLVDQYFSQHAVTYELEADEKLLVWWNQKNFIYVGRISFDKGLTYIIEAWCSLYSKHSENCPSLWIVGGSPEEIAAFRSKILDSKSASIFERAENRMKLIWWGYLDEAGISALYLKSAVLVTHSKYEPGGRVAIEAMSEGLPVIATPNGFALDCIVDWKNGFLVEYTNVNTLMMRMEHFIYQPFLSGSMGLAAKRCATNIRDKWSFLKNHLRAYSNAINNQASIESPNSQPEYDYFAKRYFAAYPILNTMINQTTLYNILQNWDIANIVDIEDKTFELDGSSFIFLISANQDNYIAKIPFTRLRIRPMYDEDCNELVTLSKQRYNRELIAEALGLSAPILKKTSAYNIILRKKYTPYIFRSPRKFLQDNLKIILAMYAYDTALFQPVFNSMNELFDEHAANPKIMEEYLKVKEINDHLAFETIFSIRYEWSWLKHKMNQIREQALKSFIKDYIHAVDSAASDQLLQEKDMPIVLVNGDLVPNNMVMDKEDIYSIDHDCLHIAWIGQDYANSIIFAAKENVDPLLWNQLISDTLDITYDYRRFPPKLLICWIIALICHELIMFDRLMKPIPSYRYLQLKVLQELLLQKQ